HSLVRHALRIPRLRGHRHEVRPRSQVSETVVTKVIGLPATLLPSRSPPQHDAALEEQHLRTAYRLVRLIHHLAGNRTPGPQLESQILRVQLRPDDNRRRKLLVLLIELLYIASVLCEQRVLTRRKSLEYETPVVARQRGL